VEVGAGLLFALISFSHGVSIASLVLAFYICLFLVLAVIDLEHGLLLNRITYPAIGISLALSPFWSTLGLPRMFPWESTMLNDFLSSLASGVVFAAPFLLIALLYKGGMGWGDVKMAGLVGLATGFPLVLVAMALSFLSGGLVAGFLLLFRLKGRKEGIPYGPFLSLGASIALLWGESLVRWYLALF
jgi:leader peptidase (prepilin peptidase)/N-methyltransferase